MHGRKRSQPGWGLVHFSAGNRVCRKKRRPKHGPVPFRGARGTVPFSRRERQFSGDVLSAAKIGTVPCERLLHGQTSCPCHPGHKSLSFRDITLRLRARRGWAAAWRAVRRSPPGSSARVGAVSGPAGLAGGISDIGDPVACPSSRISQPPPNARYTWTSPCAI